MRKSAVLFVSLLVGCASTPEQDVAMRRDVVRDVTCEGQSDCEVKWGRAIQYVLDNSSFRIQQQTDSLIQTAGPSSKNQSDLAMLISKVPLGGGKYRFDLRAGCDNAFGCYPSLEYAKAYFVRTVMDGKTGPRPQ